MTRAKDGNERARAAAWQLLTRSANAGGIGDAEASLAGAVRIARPRVTPRGAGKSVRFEVQRRLTSFDVTLDARTREVVAWQIERLGRGASTDLTPEQCLERARAAVQLPVGAVLDSARYEEQGMTTVFEACFRHEHEGVPVEQDVIRIWVNGRTGEVFRVMHFWHDVTGGAG